MNRADLGRGSDLMDSKMVWILDDEAWSPVEPLLSVNVIWCDCYTTPTVSALLEGHKGCIQLNHTALQASRLLPTLIHTKSTPDLSPASPSSPLLLHQHTRSMSSAWSDVVHENRKRAELQRAREELRLRRRGYAVKVRASGRLWSQHTQCLDILY